MVRRALVLGITLALSGCGAEHDVSEQEAAQLMQGDAAPLLVEGKPFSGTAVFRDSNGDVAFRAKLDDGRLDGLVEVFEDKIPRYSSELAWDEDKKKSVLDGTETAWNAKGKMLGRKKANNGETKILEKWCENEQKRMQVDYEKGKRARESEWDCDTGKLTKEATYDKDAKQHGDIREWTPAGVLVSQEHFEHGLEVGLREKWHANGKPSERGQLKDGKLVGKFESWDEKGRLTATGMYGSNGEKTGLWRETDTNSVRQRDYGPNGFVKRELFTPYAMALTASGQDPSVVDFYLKDGQIKLTDRIPSDYNGLPEFNQEFSWPQTSWTYAVIVARPELLDGLLARGADINQADSEGQTRLMRCGDHFNKKTSVFAFLGGRGVSFPRGCNPDQFQFLLQRSKPAQVDLKGRSALHHLLENSGDVDSTYNGIDRAKYASRLAAMRAVLKAGVPVNAADREGWSPLVIALSERRFDLARALLEAGADAKQAGPGATKSIHWVFLSALDRYSVKEDTATKEALADMVKHGADIGAPMQWNGKPTTLRDLAMENGLIELARTIDSLAGS